MPTLAPKLPYTHPFAGGYPRLGDQPLPTDPDAIDYLNRVAAADGAAVEVGVAMAVDAFVKGCKADGIWSAIKASCIMCGARTISGALVPLAGTAPTPYNFAGGDYSRTTGLKGNGSTKYLDSNRANDADGQDDHHMSVYVHTPQSSGFGVYIGASDPNVAGASHIGRNQNVPQLVARCRSASADTFGTDSEQSLFGISRDSSSEYAARFAGSSLVLSRTSQPPSSDNVGVFFRIGASTGYSDARLAFYSIGSAIPDLAALDTRVSTLVAAIAAAI